MEHQITDVELNLVVLRSVDLERAVRFYAALGLALSREQHGSGPEHLAATIGTLVLEIYPQGSADKTVGVRLGFRVKSLVNTIARLQAIEGVIVSPIQESQWGVRTVVSDPDGHRLELVEGQATANSTLKVAE